MCSNETLGRLRGELDRVDEEILKLIDERLSLCGDIRSAKRGNDKLMLRPCRQKALVEKLGAHATQASPELVRHVWRELMAHSLQLQAPTTFALVRGDNEDALLRLVREAYGSAAPITWVDDKNAALAMAANEETIAILECSRELQLPDGVIVFDLLGDGDNPIAWAAGRIDEAEFTPQKGELPRLAPWHPASWRSRPALQLPVYGDQAALQAVERRLAQRAPVVELNDVDTLRERLAAAANGAAVIVQGGDCAETFEAHSRANVCAMADLLLAMAANIRNATGHDVTAIGRIAGQYAKPRTHPMEAVNGEIMPAYRGDAVNCVQPHPKVRWPDPERMLQAQSLSETTARWLSQHVPDGSPPVYVSHEALLLNSEQAQIQFDELTGQWWAGSGHMLWIGDRTRDAAGAHVEFARGIANPVGIKCGPGMKRDELLQLLEILDPGYHPGRIVLIPRMGVELVEQKLAPLMRAVASSGRKPVWLVDPMHGNTRQVDGKKTRHFDDIMFEIGKFHEIAAAENVWPAGMHLELTPHLVTECLGGACAIRKSDLEKRYETACDPRLNGEQALQVSELTAKLYGSPMASSHV